MSLHRRFLSTLLLSAALPPRALASVLHAGGRGLGSDGRGDGPAPDAAPRTLAPASVLLRQDLITPGRAARLVGRLEGGIEFRLGERASLRVDALTSHGPRAGTVLRIFDGPVLLDRPRAGAMARPPPIILNFPWGRIGVRGTRFFAGAARRAARRLCLPRSGGGGEWRRRGAAPGRGGCGDPRAGRAAWPGFPMDPRAHRSRPGAGESDRAADRHRAAGPRRAS